MHTASSAARTKGAVRSASECTATVEMPISLAERMMRRAISPRLAISNFLMECVLIFSTLAIRARRCEAAAFRRNKPRYPARCKGKELVRQDGSLHSTRLFSRKQLPGATVQTGEAGTRPPVLEKKLGRTTLAATLRL